MQGRRRERATGNHIESLLRGEGILENTNARLNDWKTDCSLARFCRQTRLAVGSLLLFFILPLIRGYYFNDDDFHPRYIVGWNEKEKIGGEEGGKKLNEIDMIIF